MSAKRKRFCVALACVHIQSYFLVLERRYNRHRHVVITTREREERQRCVGFHRFRVDKKEVRVRIYVGFWSC
jgi:hypothetical protein